LPQVHGYLSKLVGEDAMEGDRELRQHVQELLIGLGNSPTEVAATLRRAGVRALPKDPQDCAIAVYLRAVIGGDRRVRSITVHGSTVKVQLGERTRWRWPNLVSVLLPDPVRKFISAFDQVIYPDLVRPEPARHGRAQQHDAGATDNQDTVMT
jgi:hypothetical protein